MNDDGTESLLASDTAKEHLRHVEATSGTSGAVLPSSQDEAGPTWTAGVHRRQGRPHALPGDAALVDAVRRRRLGHPRTRGRRVDVRRRRRHRHLEGLEEGRAGLELPQLDDVGGGAGRACSRRTRTWCPAPTSPSNEYSDEDPRLVTINEVAGEGDTPVAINFQQAFNAPNSPWLTLVRNAVLDGSDSVDADNDEITAVLSQ